MLLGVVLGRLGAVVGGGAPFAILSSSNICPQWIVQPVRRLMDACRAINEIVFALLFILYRLETNVRSATTLGIVGAGGIGQSLYESIRAFRYAETAAEILIVVAAVIVMDMVSARLRKALV